MHVYLIRHGESERQSSVLHGRAGAVSLTPRGRAQASAAAALIARRGASALHVSPLPRTQETAAAIADATGLLPHEEPQLNEVDFGVWSGAARDTLQDDPRWRRWNADRGRSTAPGGESMHQVLMRAAMWLTRVIDRGETTIAVTHGDVIKSTVCYVLGLPLHFHDRLEIGFASITTLVAEADRLTLLTLNEVAHAQME